MKILKFGGSSVANPERIMKVASIIRNKASEDKDLCVVVSAQSGVTDQLAEICELIPVNPDKCYVSIRSIELRHLSAAREMIPVPDQPEVLAELMALCNQLYDIVKGATLVGEVTARTRDLVLSFGEQLSAYLIYQVIKNDKLPVTFTDARLLIKTDTNYGHAKVDNESTNRLIGEYYSQTRGINIVPGFIASTSTGQTTTLGRNGSDYTASLLGAALNADLIEIWSDTDGVMTADPQYVDDVKNIGQLSYNEAMELSHFGAKIIFPASLQPAMAKRIPIVVKNTFNPSHNGTYICESKMRSNGFFKGISSLRNISLINIEGSGMLGVAGVAARMFSILSAEKFSVILVSQASSEHSICIALMSEDSEKAVLLLQQTFSQELGSGLISSIDCITGLAIVAVVGENMRNMPGVAARVFAPLGRNGINIKAIAQGSSELNISFVINENDLRKALRILHQSLFKNEIRQIHLYVAGTGLVGSRLIEMIQEKNEHFTREKIDLKLCGLINSRKMLTGMIPSDFKMWKELISCSEKKADFGIFVDDILSSNLENSILVDVTPAEEPVRYYTRLLSSSISIVSANKKANSDKSESYKEIHSAARKRNVAFYYETNVGAGLPVINTIRNILAGGDRIVKIECVISGTLNWLLSEYNGTLTFGSLVKRAKEMGLTEPDPFEDLNGNDVTRKCLILARESGLDLEPDEVHSSSLLPPGLPFIQNASQFFTELDKNEQWYYDKYLAASSSGKVLRFLGVVEEGSVKTGLYEVDSSNPFYGLKGSENCIVLTTNYYSEFPMVIRGPGAGTDVTASGILADIVRIAEQIKPGL